MTFENPLISCLCVTRGKPKLLQIAIDCFLSQTYKNKELIIVFEDDDQPIIELLRGIKSNAITSVEVQNSSTVYLGELRNIAIDNANGEYICQWDDDDWYHVGRLEFQYEIIKQSGLPGCILTQWTVFNKKTNKAYISNRRVWEGSIMCKKSIVKEQSYQNKKMGEDTAVIHYLLSKDYLFLIGKTPNLYIYIYHGANTWNYNHWNHVFDMSHELHEKKALRISEILRGKYSNQNASLLLDELLENQIYEV